MLFRVFDTMMATDAYFIFQDMPQTPHMAHKEFRLQACRVTFSSNSRHSLIIKNPPGQQLERTLHFLQVGLATVVISRPL